MQQSDILRARRMARMCSWLQYILWKNWQSPPITEWKALHRRDSKIPSTSPGYELEEFFFGLMQYFFKEIDFIQKNSPFLFLTSNTKNKPLV